MIGMEQEKARHNKDRAEDPELRERAWWNIESLRWGNKSSPR